MRFYNICNYKWLKYDPSGNQLWAARYNGLGSLWDDPEAIDLDDSDNVYVTGRSYGSGTGYDYATVKYDPAGNELWVARHDGPSHYDHASAIAVDASGNVYVTGTYVTVKYISLESPPGAIEALITAIISLNLQQGITNSLDAKLGAALNALDDVNTNNDAAAVNTLEAFINAVEAQRGNAISDPDADGLMQAAVNIINTLNGS